MKIDIATGAVIFSTGSLVPDLDSHEFRKLTFGQATKQVMGGKWTLYQFEAEPGIYCSAYFEADLLKFVSIAFALPSDDDEAGTEKQESARHELHCNWLQANVGQPPYEYSWGGFESSRDVKTGDAGISIRYKALAPSNSQHVGGWTKY